MSEADVRITAAPAPDPAPAPRPAPDLLRFICTSNPFYALSAALFLAGLWISFGGQTQVVQAGALMSGLAGYTLLLAVTAWLLVRFGSVWDDARTVLLLVVLMFLATSVTFDEVLVSNPEVGYLCYLAGMLFAVLVSEGILRGIRLGLPVYFRLSYYLILSLFFLYPLALRPLVPFPRSEELLWGLFGFSTVAGLVFLTLLPAIRKGPDYVRDNGSPWRWPLYPWALFGLLALAVPARAFLLCWSMHLLIGANLDDLVFGPYFVVPFGFALAILLLEIGIVSSRRLVKFIALCFPPALLALAAIEPPPNPIYVEFREAFAARLGGGPAWLTLLAGVAFYAYAAVRHRLALVVAAAALTGCAGLTMWQGYFALRRAVAGLDHLLLSLALFVVAVLISLGKAGVLRRWLAPLRRQPAPEASAAPSEAITPEGTSGGS